MKLKFYLFFLFAFAVHFSFAQVELKDCLKKVESNWGTKYHLCSNDPSNNYYVILKNTCNLTIDVKYAIQDTSGFWITNERLKVNSKDTIIGFACSGSGKYQCWFRNSADTSPFPHDTVINRDFISKETKKGNFTNQEEQIYDLFAKLLVGDVKRPLANHKVSLKNQKGEFVQTSTTNNNGDFEFNRLNKNEELEIVIEKTADLKEDKVFLAKRNGTVIKEIAKGKDNNNIFVYKLLPSDINVLSIIPEEDPYFSLHNLKKGKTDQIIIGDNINYEMNSFVLLPEAKRKLDKVIIILNENPEFKVEVISHTDCSGDDNQNLKLSEKRAGIAVEYIISKGINKVRVSGKGLGETKPINHCVNGIKCSEEELSVNRRTEFRFIK